MSDQLNPLSLPPEQFERLVAERLVAQKGLDREMRYGGVSQRPLLWTALTPSWTMPLAVASGQRSGQGENLAGALERLQESGVVDVSESLLTEERDTDPTLYSMNSAARWEVLSDFSDAEGIRQLRKAAAEIGERITQAHVSYVPPTTERWAKLAQYAQSGDALVSAFEEQVEKAIEHKDVAEVLKWVEAARPLAALLTRDLDTGLQMSLLRVSRRLELLRRAETDRQHLRTYLPRNEQDAAFSDLMNGPDDRWALHYIGLGGVGKTMLVRHIATDLAPSPEIRAATARVDFDFLSPDYPSLSPGLLLWSFAQELRAYDSSGQANQLFDKADRVLRELHQRLRADMGTQSVESPTLNRQFREALSLYIQAFRLLPLRIVLIVDTCEELAKASSGRSTPQNVEETFRILRALHDGPRTLEDENAPPSTSDGIAGLRVIFSGRRALSRKGVNWTFQNTSLKERGYLRLHEIRGFTRDEAKKYLAEKAKVPDSLIETIISKSMPDSGGVPGIQWDDPKDRPEDVSRCSPYDLKLYADWAKEDPPPSQETIRNASRAQYVELRIIRRLKDERLERLLPAVVLLGHIDREALRVCSGEDSETVDYAFERFALEEWIGERVGTGSTGEQTETILHVEPRMHSRLWSYFEERGAFNVLQERAARHFEDVTLRRDLTNVDWSVFDAALRVMQLDPDPQRAVDWWQRAESRILADRGAKWMLEVTRAVLGSAAAQIDPLIEKDRRESWLRPLVLATHASALLQTNAVGEIESVWREISSKTDRIPVAAVREKIRLRATAGEIAAARFQTEILSGQEVAKFWTEVQQLKPDGLDQQLAASLIAAAEAIVEQAETTQVASSAVELMIPPDPSQRSERDNIPALVLARLIDSACPEVHPLVAFSYSLAARALCIVRQHEIADTNFARALEECQKFPSDVEKTVWTDWLPPQDIDARIRLEFTRLSGSFLSPADTLKRLSGWKKPPTCTDRERLHSKLIDLGMALRPFVPNSDGLGWGFGMMTDPESLQFNIQNYSVPESCNAHRSVPPLFATMCRVFAARGEVDVMLTRLGEISSQATRFTIETVRHAERTHADIFRRMRLRDEAEGSFRSLVNSPSLADAERVWSLDGLEGPRNRKPIPDVPQWVLTQPESVRRTVLHAIWRTTCTLEQARAEAAIRWGNSNFVPWWDGGRGLMQSLIRITMSLDLTEVSMIKKANGYTVSEEIPPFNLSLTIAAEGAPPPDEELRLWLRIEAISPKQFGNGAEKLNHESVLITRLGVRRAAEIALDEGEMLALRLPDRAAVILSRSLAYFKEAHDPVGQTIAATALALTSREARAGVDEIRESYVQALASMSVEKRQEALPTWDRLNSLVVDLQNSESTADFTTTLRPPGWRPWLKRIVLCLFKNAATTKVLESYGSALPGDILGAFVKSNRKPLARGMWQRLRAMSVSLLYVLRFLGITLAMLAAGNIGFRFLVGLSGNHLTFNQTILPYLGTLLSVSFGVGITIGVQRAFSSNRNRLALLTAWAFLIAGGYLLLYYSLSSVLLGTATFQTPESLHALVSGIFALLVGVLATPTVLRLAQSYIVSFSHFRLQFSSKGESGYKTSAFRPNITLHWRGMEFGSFPPRVATHVYEMTDVQIPVEGPYEEMSKALPRELMEQFALRARQLRSEKMTVIIEGDAELHALPWEAMIFYQAVIPQTPSLVWRRTPFLFQRVAIGRKERRVSIRSDAISVIAVADGAAKSIAERGWQPLRHNRRFTLSLESAVRNRPTVRTSSGAQILHLIGSVEETNAGLRYRLTDPSLSGSSMNQSSIADVSSDDFLLRSEDTISRFSALQLVVIQGTPSSFAQERLESDRMDAMLARRFGAELFVHGAPAVIVIPSLKPDMSVAVLQRLAHAIKTRRRGTWTLHTAVLDVRAIVAEAEPGKSAGPEAALDICFFCTDGWDGRLIN